MKNKIIALLALPLLVYAGAPQCQTNEESNSGCPKSAADALLVEELYQSGYIGSILITLLSGHTQTAINDLGQQLATNVLLLDSIQQHPSCGESEETIKRIAPLLRVIAAINHATPISQINNNKKVMAILDRAIKADHEHYEQLLKRSKHWSHGIN
jgi:hypothetical protein